MSFGVFESQTQVGLIDIGHRFALFHDSPRQHALAKAFELARYAAGKLGGFLCFHAAETL